jgi:sialate O-acetylesterase
MGQPQEFRLDLGAEKLPLAGDWSWKIEQSVPALPPNMPAPFSPNGPSTLWQAMVRPLVPYGLKGAIWYQGESNVGRDREYAVLMPTMVQAWRREFGNDFGFLFVQLANFQARAAAPGDSAWAALRDSQMEVLSLPKTGFATAIDIGEANDIHPRNKRDVGRRLAASARTFAYPGSDGWKAQSPRVATVRWESSSAVIDWLDAASLKTTDGKAPVGFAVQSGGAWVWAQAEIKGRQVVVRHPEGREITAVQYAWADNPEVNLVNEHGLPAICFRRMRD